MTRLIIIAILVTQPINAFSESLIDVYRSAIDNDSSLAVAEASRLSLLEIKPQALSNLLPNVNLSSNFNRQNQALDYNNPQFGKIDTTYNTNSYSLEITQSILNIAAMTKVKEADISSAIANINYAIAYQNLLFKVITRYFELLAAIDNQRLVTAERDEVANYLNVLNQRHKLGKISDVDLHDIQANYYSVVSKLNDAATRVEQAREHLREITKNYYVTVSVLKTTAQPLYPLPNNPDTWVDTALTDNFSLLSAKLSSEVAKYNLKYQQQLNYPTISLKGSYVLFDNTDVGTSGYESQNTSVFLQLDWNLYRGGLNQSYIKQARFSSKSARSNYIKLKQAIEKETRGTFFVVLQEISRITELYQTILIHQKAMTANAAAYEVGVRSITELLRAIESLYRFKRDYSEARYKYLIQYARLHLLAGKLDESLLLKISNLLE